MYMLILENGAGKRQIVLGRYTEAEHARRDCVLRRVMHPRAEAISVTGPNGGRLMRLKRR